MPFFGLARCVEVESEIEKLNNNISDKIETLNNNVSDKIETLNNVIDRLNEVIDTKVGNIASEDEQPPSSSSCRQLPGVEYIRWSTVSVTIMVLAILLSNMGPLKKENAVSPDTLNLENKCWLASDTIDPDGHENKMWVCADYPKDDYSYSFNHLKNWN